MLKIFEAKLSPLEHRPTTTCNSQDECFGKWRPQTDLLLGWSRATQNRRKSHVTNDNSLIRKQRRGRCAHPDGHSSSMVFIRRPLTPNSKAIGQKLGYPSLQSFLDGRHLNEAYRPTLWSGTVVHSVYLNPLEHINCTWLRTLVRFHVRWLTFRYHLYFGQLHRCHYFRAFPAVELLHFHQHVW